MVFLAIVLLFTACVNENDYTAVDPNSTEKQIVEIPMGSTAKSIGKILEDEGLIKSRGSFVYYLKQNNMVDQLKAGKYELSKAMDIKTITSKMANGEVFTNTVDILIPEGFEVSMIADTLHEELGIDKEKFIKLANTHKFEQKFIQFVPEYDANSGVKCRLEGYLFPATYTFNRDVTELDILNTMLDRFDAEITDEYYNVLENSKLDFAETITLASIIEREGADHEEFPTISGVFMNRVDADMLFQSCATVQYIIEERKPVLLNEDIAIDNPYNTYKYAGLPPSPIACPGAVAIKAAFYPETHDYYYFVVSGKNDGKHTFSRTLDEHERAKAENLN